MSHFNASACTQAASVEQRGRACSKRRAWEKRRYLAASGFDFLGRRVDGAGEGGVRRVGLGGHDDVGALLCGPAQVVGYNRYQSFVMLCERLHRHVELPQGNGETDAPAGASDEDGLALEPQVDLVAVHDVPCCLIK